MTASDMAEDLISFAYELESAKNDSEVSEIMRRIVRLIDANSDVYVDDRWQDKVDTGVSDCHLVQEKKEIRKFWD